MMALSAKRPVSVTIIGLIYIAAGTAGLVYHLKDFKFQPFHYDIVLISLVRVLAIVAGVCMLRGANWARWLALAWLAFHVVIGFLNGWVQGVTHAVFLAVITFFLLRREAAEYFGARS